MLPHILSLSCMIQEIRRRVGDNAIASMDRMGIVLPCVLSCVLCAVLHGVAEGIAVCASFVERSCVALCSRLLRCCLLPEEYVGA